MNIFFIGIGGKGLNGMARICLEKGHKVSGVDLAKKREINELKDRGAKIFNEHNESNITKDIDLVVYSSLFSVDCPERVSARKLGIEILKRAEFLDRLTRDDFRISICGSHGKSTTTAITGLSFINSNVDASIFGGAYAKELHGYNHLGKSKYTIMEACEYDRSFHNLIGDVSIIMSLETMHLEYYKDEADMMRSFQFFIEKHNPHATIIANGDNPKIRKLVSDIPQNVILFGFDFRNDYVIDSVVLNETSSSFSVWKGPQKILNNLEIKIPGTYNIMNFVATTVLLDFLNIPLTGVIATAKDFSGVGRRFEIMKASTGHIFIDDFAHHHSQVKCLFDGIQQFYPGKKTYAVFQPKQFKMMRNFIKEYGRSFTGVEEVIVTDIIPGLGDTDFDKQSITAKDMMDSIQKYSGRPVKYIKNFPDIVNYIKDNYSEDSIITTVGSGDIFKVRDQFMNLSV